MTDPAILTFCGKTTFAIGGHGASVNVTITNESMDSQVVNLCYGHTTVIVGEMAGGSIEHYSFIIDEEDAKQSPDNTVAVMTESGMIVSKFAIYPFEPE